jgi:hypothetical protein
MTLGDILRNCVVARGVFSPSTVPWDQIADDYLQALASQGLVDGVFDPVNRRWMRQPVQNTWKAELQRYGRHLPSCPVGAECTCGFAEIERQF